MTTGRRAELGRYRETYLPAILDVVDRVVDDAGLQDSTLAEMLDYQMATGGKRLRAVLPLMVADVFGADPERMIPFGAACELIHNATLIHDDLQDGDRVRRGQPAVWTRFGAPQAINLGDAMLYLAPRCLDYVDVDPGRRWEVARQIFDHVLRVIDGQEREFDLAFEASTEEYERMVVGKTSGLFALPITGAARLCDGDETVVEALKISARHLGVLFQIQDDVVDLYGEKGRDGAGADLREGKISALVIAFRDRAPEKEVQRLQQVLEAEREATTDEDVAWAIESIRRRGALDDALDAIAVRRERALAVPTIDEHLHLSALIEGLIDVFLEPIAELTAQRSTRGQP